MHTKIYTALKQTYARLGLGETILKGQAASLEATGLVTDENLDAVVSAQKQFLEVLQRGIDKRVAGALSKMSASHQRESNGNRAANRHGFHSLIEKIVGETITSLQKQLRNDHTEGACESIPAYAVRPLAKEQGNTAWAADQGFSAAHSGDDRMTGNRMPGARHTQALTRGLPDKPSCPPVRRKPARRGRPQRVAGDGSQALPITEQMIHSEFRRV